MVGFRYVNAEECLGCALENARLGVEARKAVEEIRRAVLAEAPACFLVRCHREWRRALFMSGVGVHRPVAAHLTKHPERRLVLSLRLAAQVFVLHEVEEPRNQLGQARTAWRGTLFAELSWDGAINFGGRFREHVGADAAQPVLAVPPAS